jgi:predicted RND superfamily exporter protein
LFTARSVTGDIPLVIASFTFTLVSAVLTQLHRTRPDVSSASQASLGLSCVALSVFSGYGVVIFFGEFLFKTLISLFLFISVWAINMTTFFCLTFTGVPFTSLSLVGIFILLGVGVDDVLVLLESFRMARITIPNGGTVETRVRFATERAGVSITITSATSVIAFSLGSMTVSSFLLSYGQLD